ncbi:MAG: carboxypeptidase-like regulatory domain-containing protein [Saprospiraceae bacterium]|nr:carboxypeptidase-like regulatory domain-containing protein [Saprospiraceae bacterium]
MIAYKLPIFSFLVFLLLFIHASVLLSQNIMLTGEIYSKSNYPLIGATISINENKGTTTNERGQFELAVSNEEKEVNLRIRMLGFESLDTIVKVQQNTYVQIKLQEKIYEQVEVVVQESKNSALDIQPWTILDIKTLGEHLYLLWYKSGNRYIGRVNQAGVILEQYELEERFNQLFISCSGRLYALSDEKALEVALMEDQLYLLKTYELEQFETFVQPCLINNSEGHLFRQFTQHNKCVIYYHYDEKKEKKVIHQIYDENAQKVARTYYNDVISLYYYFTENPEENAIDEGAERNNAIVERTWNGDLKDLIINNEIHKAASYYMNVEARPIDVKEFFQNGHFFIVDPVNQQLWSYLSSESTTFKAMKLEGMNWEMDYNIFYNPQTARVYFELDEKLFEFSKKNRSTYTLDYIQDLTTKGHFPRGFQIIQNNLFYYAQIHPNRPTTKLHKVSLGSRK